MDLLKFGDVLGYRIKKNDSTIIKVKCFTLFQQYIEDLYNVIIVYE